MVDGVEEEPQINGGNTNSNTNLPLFETTAARGRPIHRLYCLTMLVAILSMWVYRLTHIPTAAGRFPWLAMLFAEVVFGLYWFISQATRWRVVYRYPFKDRLSSRYKDEKLPAVDIFICTADPTMEPPSMVIGTVLSVMSFNYPPEKLSVYLSDDAGSDLTFYGLLEASQFATRWIPFCKKYHVEPRTPQRYFSDTIPFDGSEFSKQWNDMKVLYDDIKNRVDSAAARGSVSKEVKDQHRGFSEWNSTATRQDHQPIVQILIDGWNPAAVDAEGNRLPTLVYLSREKRPRKPHNFKAGAMNALIRVSSEISNAPIILNVDCDMYANDPEAVRDALCFFLDEKHGQRISYVQHPQYFYNIVKDDVYANVSLALNEIELCGIDGFGGALYIGTGCFHRRESLSGKKYLGSHKIECHNVEDTTKGRGVRELEEASKALAACSYENGTLWGKEMGLVYGCPVEDMATGLTIHCRGWRPVFYNPRKHGFLGIAPTSLDVCLVQYKRWSEGLFQIFVSKYSPFINGRGKISLGLQIGYCNFLLWPPLSLPTFCYAIVPAISLIRGTPIFPEASTSWFFVFTYVYIAKTGYTLAEDLLLGDTLRGWCNLQRMTVIRRTTAVFFALLDNIKKQLGLKETSFALTSKVVDDEARKRYEKGVMEFGSDSIMLSIITTLALLNLFGFGWGVFVQTALMSSRPRLVPEVVICAAMVALNLPVYEAVFLRRDAGSVPPAVKFKAAIVASIACVIAAS
ncbi:cellulose synthase-like protein E6 [Andrographis paniculata]|uniref:cellulose synthase-like protein E6 n=1 Tax=Andrographis paniculata TaxID=175694 RepID=UPI0021E99EA1|nr:cellulose synthase-like protein E6 [Andrographis paniculata]